METFLTCEEVAARYCVKTATVWEWVREKRLAAIKTGKRYVFKPQDLERFEVENSTVKEAVNKNAR